MIQQSLAYEAEKFPLKSVLFVKLLLLWGCSQKTGHKSCKYAFIVKTRIHIYSCKQHSCPSYLSVFKGHQTIRLGRQTYWSSFTLNHLNKSNGNVRSSTLLKKQALYMLDKLFSFKKRRLSGAITTVFKYLKSCCIEERSKTYSMCINTTRSNGLKLHQGKSTYRH